MTGFFHTLTNDQKLIALAYRGDEGHGDAGFLVKPFDRAHVGVAWMLAAGLLTAAALLAISGCATVADFGACAIDVCN